MVISANLGFPRIGANRELKRAVEGFWNNTVTQQELLSQARKIREINWQRQLEAGIDHIPSNDFSLYDQVLDTTAMLGAVPHRYDFTGGNVDLKTYFAMARGNNKARAMEMTKWFDTNYHYLVPEFTENQIFSLSASKVIDEFLEAKELGISTRPVLLGPVSYLMLGKSVDGNFNPLTLLNRILPIYEEVIEKLSQSGAQWIQIDEPALALDLDENVSELFDKSYKVFWAIENAPQICLATYFGDISDKLTWLNKLPVDAIHIDLVRAPQQLDSVLMEIPENMKISLGVINGRNIWRANLSSIKYMVDKAVQCRGSDNIIIAPSCSLLHSPVDITAEQKLDTELKNRMAFAVQKLDELRLLKKGVESGWDFVEPELQENKRIFDQASISTSVNNPDVRKRVENLDKSMFSRQSLYPVRRIAQSELLNLPNLPTTTIGSFPQTSEIRKARAGFKKARISEAEYTNIMQAEIKKVIEFQNQIGLDVLVHGEPERNDMVEYFGQMLGGFAFTENGWVQSYGSRCVKPPIIYGDVYRPEAMTVSWAEYAQSLTEKPVKGMLTGPVTILQWSFVREDQPRRDTAFQIALAIRDEVKDLQDAGINIIQIDEAALKEGTPLRSAERSEYFNWAVNAFRLATSCANDSVQIHTHMCYSEFNDIMQVIAALDADVISIEASRSDDELLDAFINFDYPNEIGPGVYDIHSPRVPSVQDIEQLLGRMLKILRKDQLWVNPDCGLKTRAWSEVKQSLENMVIAAKALR